MRRYWIFRFSTYYPEGGIDDLWKTAEDANTANAYADDAYDEGYHAQIVDITTGEVIRRT